MRMPTARAVFLDKDGTLIDNVPYNAAPDRIRLADGAGDALRSLRRAGFRLFVVSNQSGIARGLIAEEAMVTMQAHIALLLQRDGVALDGFFYCPHWPQGQVARFSVHCDCRKPAPGMLLRAAREHAIALTDSWMVGDILDDVEAGRRAGCRTVLIDNGNETDWTEGPLRRPHWQVRDLRQAATLITQRVMTPRTMTP